VGIEDATSEATAVFSDAFQVAGRDVGPQVPEMIERDRVLMACRPGMLRKLLPLRVDADGVTSGGVYLFDTYENAAEYGRWVAEDFIVDVGWGDINFLDRPIFIEATSQVWNLIGAEDFADVRTRQDVMRFERWHTLQPVDEGMLQARWPEVRDRAEAAGLSSVYLMYSPDRHHPQLGLLTVAANEKAPTGYPAEDLAPLESAPSLGDEIADGLGATKVFDRTSWVYEVWFPIEEGDDHEGSTVWPNSPPFPGAEAPVAQA
jgi:hypothetical protein